MSHSNTLALFFIFICRTLAQPQGNLFSDAPSSILAQLSSIIPIQSDFASYFSEHPAAFTTFENKISSFETAHPSFVQSFESAFLAQSVPTGGAFFSQGVNSGSIYTVTAGNPDVGLSPTQSAEFLSLESAFFAQVTGINTIAYITQHPGQDASFIAAASSILGPEFTDLFPGGVGSGIGGGGAGGATAPIFTMTSQASQAGATMSQSTAVISRVTSQATLRTTQQVTQQQQSATGGSQTLAAQTTNTDNKAPLQTPALALGLSGAAVAAVAGIAALL